VFGASAEEWNMTEANDDDRQEPIEDERPEADAGAADTPGEGVETESQTSESAAAAPEHDGEVARLKEALLRMQADMDNREKRFEREMAKVRKFALESLMRDLVQVLDSMDQALASADPQDAEQAYEGMELTRKQALQVLGSHGLEVLDPLGESFDPSWHEAMSTQPTEGQPPDTVFQVLQKGYRLNDRLIRPARVIVAKAP